MNLPFKAIKAIGNMFRRGPRVSGGTPRGLLARVVRSVEQAPEPRGVLSGLYDFERRRAAALADPFMTDVVRPMGPLAGPQGISRAMPSPRNMIGSPTKRTLLGNSADEMAYYQREAQGDIGKRLAREFNWRRRNSGELPNELPGAFKKKPYKGRYDFDTTNKIFYAGRYE